ncbi:MAG: NOL1/NOP2/sun family putative RNA methylase [Candidatus Altiarchaeota archaeon]|nr:NOL1/NOP2/sun family putative RNA methylase [Candidatus Altiarchaeota archaeon]
MGAHISDSALDLLKRIPGFDVGAYLSTIDELPERGIRINTLKIGVKEAEERLEKIGWNLKNIPWCDYGFRADEGSPGNTVEHSLGYYFIQDAGSMSIPGLFSLNERSRVLDLCAAPGAKTTHLSQIMRNSGAVVANDAGSERIKALAMNVQRMGAINCMVSHTDGRNLPKWGKARFDCVLVDAPCSGLGQVRKMGKPGKERAGPEKYWPVQKNLITAGFDCLKAGGELIYSTCTFTVEENEAVVQHLLENRNASIMKLGLKLKHCEGFVEGGGVEFSREMQKCARIYPWQNGTDGFFVCKVKNG